MHGLGIKGCDSNFACINNIIASQHNMKYVSTRGGCSPVSFQDAILTGLAPDGGLYVPQTLPSISKSQLKSWAGLSYPSLAEKVLRLFIDEEEISTEDLSGILKGCFSSFPHPDIAPLKQVGPYNIMELWHGPTGAFKDLAMTLFARLADHFLKVKNTRGVALVGTLGDTGSAAIHSFKETTNISLVILFPKDGCQRLQRLQMTTVQSPRLRMYACDCPSDEFDTAIMSVFADEEFSKSHNLLWLNGINTARFILQTVHYVYGYLQLCPSCDREVEFYIPSGGFANAAGGLQAQCIGLPIRIVPVVNENDAFYRCLETGRLERPLKVVKTFSCAMDTVFPHNVERVLYMLSGGDGGLIRSIMKDYYKEGHAVIPQSLLDAASAGNGRLRSMRVEQEEAFEIAKSVWGAYGYQLCPHTAVAVAGENKDRKRKDESGSLSVCLATATAAKFQEFLSHLSIPVPKHPCVEGLEEKEEVYSEMKKGEDWEQILKQAIIDMYRK